MPKQVKNIDKDILFLLNVKESVTLSELSEKFGYSLPVLRKICNELASKHNIDFHRGKLSLKELLDSEDNSVFQKAQIAKKAISLVDDGDTIYIGAGTTTYSMCKYLHTIKNLTVITNSIPVLTELLPNTNITVICVGGLLQHQDKALVGDFSDYFIKNFHVDKIFLGTECIDINRGAYRSVIQENMTESTVSNLNGKIYILADSSKFGKKNTWLWLPIEKIHVIITDTNLPNKYKENIKDMNIQLLI